MIIKAYYFLINNHIYAGKLMFYDFVNFANRFPSFNTTELPIYIWWKNSATEQSLYLSN